MISDIVYITRHNLIIKVVGDSFFYLSLHIRSYINLPSFVFRIHCRWNFINTLKTFVEVKVKQVLHAVKRVWNHVHLQNHFLTFYSHKRLRKMSRNSIKNFADLQIAFLCLTIWFYAHYVIMLLYVGKQQQRKLYLNNNVIICYWS